MREEPLSDELVGRTVSHYRVVERLGVGGMGEVYRGEDLHLRRPVALKFLLPSLTRDAEARERFEREAQAASALDHPSICTIHDIDSTDDGHVFIAMSLYEGETLKTRLERGPLSVDQAVDVARRVADGLARAHAHGIVHRDVKPANLVLTTTGEVKILDFGIAKLADRTDLTSGGASPGTASYMAPEQILGDALDERADVWALGVVLFEMLTGRNPFGRDRLEAAAVATLAVDPPPPSELRDGVPRELDALVGHALRRAPAERLPSARAFADALAAIREPAGDPLARTRPGVRLASVAMVVAVAASVLALRQVRAARAREAALAAVPRIAEMVDAERYVEARELAVRSLRALPEDTGLVRLLALATDSVTIVTDPPGARVRLLRFSDPPSDDTLDLGIAPVRGATVTRGSYRAVITLDGYEPVERPLSSALVRAEAGLFGGSIAIEDSVTLLRREEADGRVAVPGGRYELVGSAAPRGEVADLDPFLIDRFEVSNERYLAFIRAGGYADTTLWRHPFVREGGRLTRAEAMSILVDRSGLAGPRGWVGQQYPEGRGEHPVTGVTWYEAEAFAAWEGARLPTLFQWEKAARDGHVAHGADVVMPWGAEAGARAGGRARFAASGTGPVDELPFGISPFGAYAMAGNVREWVRSAATGGHLATGGSWRDPGHTFHAIGVFDDFFASDDLGFRTARPLRSNATADGDGPIGMADRTPVYQPVDAATFRTLLTHYRYDPTPLRPEVVERVELPDWVREKVTFDGPGGARVPAYLFLPKSAEPPYQTMVFVPGRSAFAIETAASAAEWAIGPLVRAGRAVLTVTLTGMVERSVEPVSAPPAPSSVAFRDLMVLHATEVRRGIDYLETRSDIDRERLAYVGLSFGAGSRLVLAGTDDRYAAVVFIGGGIDERLQPTLPEASNINFAPYITPPKLLLNGSNDDEHPWVTRALPLWDLLREPKELVLVEGAGHVPAVEDRIPPISRFLDRVLGPVRARTGGG
jgi:formylglycine-generating enzyme required for sulfatase activity/dienelactone hydrolase